MVRPLTYRRALPTLMSFTLNVTVRTYLNESTTLIMTLVIKGIENWDYNLKEGRAKP